MIDRSKKYWTGDSPEDIDPYLRLYVEEPGLEVKPVVCRGCGGDHRLHQWEKGLHHLGADAAALPVHRAAIGAAVDVTRYGGVVVIDRSKKYWTGDSPEDIGQYLRLYAEEPGLEVKPVTCHGCGGDAFEVRCSISPVGL